MIRLEKPAILSTLKPGHDVIEASAGTGKTYTLERLVADQVIQGKALERLLVVTFTEKAALELKTRIRSYLQELLAGKGQTTDAADAWELSPEVQERLGAALRAFDRATISTIHGFCRQVLQESALEGGTLFDQELVDERRLFGEAFRLCLTTRFAVEEDLKSLIRQAVEGGSSMSAVEDLLWSAHNDGGEIHPRPEDWQQSLRTLDPAWNAQIEEIKTNWKQAGVNANTIRAAADQMGKLLTSLAAHGGDSIALSLSLPDCQTDSLIKACVAPGLAGVARVFSDWFLACNSCAPTIEVVLTHAFLPSIREEMARRCREDGLFTFSRMIQGVVEALHSETLVQRLAKRFDLVLVDEFQDTDPRQWEIFHRVFSASGRMLLIGDPKQAIYGFRGGDLPTYQQACASLLQGQAPARLNWNFRSTQDMIDAHHQLLLGPDRNDSAAFFTDPGLYPMAVQCGNPTLAALVDGKHIPPVDLFWVDRVEGGQRLWRRVALALARHLKQLKNSHIQFGSGLGTESHVLGYGDMQILVGKATEGELVAQALRAEGIPCAFYKQKGLFKTREAEEWLDVLRAVAAPRDRSLQAPAFMSSFFGCSLEDLQGLPELPEDHPAATRLLEWNALARKHRYPELISALLEESGLARRLLLCEQGLRSLVNFRHLGETLLEQATQEAASLEDLIRQLVRWRSGEATPASEDGDLQRLEGEEGAVQILTLHMAKGLEAPIVAIFAFGSGRPATVHRYHANGRRCLYVGPLPGGSLKEQVDREDDEERQRLLYVALTRAQAKLVLFAFEQIDSKGNYRKVRGAYEVLNRRLLARKQQGFPPLFRLEEMPYTRLEAMQETDAPDLSTLVLPALAKPDLPDYAALRFQARPFITTSYTALQHQLEDAEDTSRGDRDQPGARPASEDLPGGTHVGQTLHELLEWADLDLVRETPFDAWKQRQEVRDCIQETLRLHGVPMRCETRVGQLVHAALSTSLPLGPDGGTLQICRTDRCLRETDFLMRWIDSDCLSEAKDLLKGSIDLLCEQDGRTYFLDWKSNLLAGYDFESLATCVEHGYRLQAKIYLQASLAFLDIRDETDYENRFGGILYVFLRGLPDEGTWFHRPSWAEAKRWKQELQKLHKEVIHA